MMKDIPQEQTDLRALENKRIGIASYPTLFQSTGGLAMKVRTTVRHLNDIGVDARFINLLEESIGDYDLVHVFSAVPANHRIVQAAKGFGKPVVISPIIVPPMSRIENAWAAFLTNAVRRLTRWQYDTSYGQRREALDGTDRIIALGEEEKRLVIERFGQHPSKVTIIPNGVGDQFWTARPDTFRSRIDLQGPLVLHVGIIGPVKNQLGLVRALREDPVTIALIGTCNKKQEGYLNLCLAEGRGRVHYLGEFPHGDDVLVSAYAAADVLAVPSQYEGMSNCVLEALASGTPVVTTRHNSFDSDKDPTVYREVSSSSLQEIREAVMALIEMTPDPEQCRQMVRHLSWRNVASRVAQVYADLLEEQHQSQ
jgi:glycosyltransferase involved in cell wall biosynthesis